MARGARSARPLSMISSIREAVRSGTCAGRRYPSRIRTIGRDTSTGRGSAICTRVVEIMRRLSGDGGQGLHTELPGLPQNQMIELAHLLLRKAERFLREEILDDRLGPLVVGGTTASPRRGGPVDDLPGHVSLLAEQLQRRRMSEEVTLLHGLRQELDRHLLVSVPDPVDQAIRHPAQLVV